MEYEINGWEGYYISIHEEEIKVFSSWGVPKGIPKGNPRPFIIIPGKRRELSLQISPYGYIRVDLNMGKQGKRQLFLHRLIAETLIPNPNNLECVDHIDGNKLNNQPSNLQWITRGDNVRKAQEMGRWGTPPKSYEITFLDQKKLIVTNISKFARENGYAATKLVAVSKGRRKLHKDVIKVIEL
jgi:hypothetical protein